MDVVARRGRRQRLLGKRAAAQRRLRPCRWGRRSDGQGGGQTDQSGAQPDLLADITDLSAIKSGSADAVWSAHCIEHLYLHQVRQALEEAYRILADDGFLCVIVPDLQTIASHVAADRLHEMVYQSPAGPISAHDMIFGYGAALAQGHTNMAHNCGFTPALLE